METKTKGKYTSPSIEIIELKQVASILFTSPGGGGNQPPTENDNSDNDW